MQSQPKGNLLPNFSPRALSCQGNLELSVCLKSLCDKKYRRGELNPHALAGTGF